MTYHESTLRQFLLAKLEESERQRLEEEVLGDDSLFELAEAIDGELIQDLAAGKLSGEDSRPLEERLRSSRHAAAAWEFHRRLNAKLQSGARDCDGTFEEPDGAAPESQAWYRRRLEGRSSAALLAALLTLALALPIFKVMQRSTLNENRLLTTQLQELRDRERGDILQTAPIKVAYILSPLQRSGDKAPRVGLQAGTEIVELWLQSPFSDGRFRVRFRSQNQDLAISDELSVLSEEWGSVVVVEVPEEWLGTGSLELILDRFDTEWSSIASYSVDLSKE